MKQLMALFSVVVIILASCTSYPEGPGLTFRKAENRIANSWVVDKAYDPSGAEATGSFDGERYLFREDGVLKREKKISGSFQTQNQGTWKFINDKEEVAIELENTFGTERDTFSIMKLKKDEFWYTTTHDFEMRLVPESSE